MKLNFIGRLTGAALITALAAWTGCSSTSNNTVPLADFNCPSAQTLCGDAASATCADLRKDAANCGACGTACKDGEVCSAGRCEISCGPGLSECSGACTNVKADAANCGECGTSCGASEVCSNGACAANCQPGLTDCVGSCVNTKSDVYNCGGCDVICAAGEVCSNGKCELSCAQGLKVCDGLCTDTHTDVANCGACGTSCSAGEACTGGACALACQSGLTNCDGRCVDKTSDEMNCGACGSHCAAGEVCSNGACAVGCQAGRTDCSGACVDTMNDNANCGACGNACGATEKCSNGTCAANCSEGLSVCSGLCANLKSDPSNCGACGVACSASQFCAAGACVDLCKAPNTTCGQACTSLDSDPANCGSCGNACSATQVCTSGACVAICTPGDTRLCAGVCGSGTQTCKADGSGFGDCSAKLETKSLFSDSFADNSQGWTLGSEWAIGPLVANPSICQVGKDPTDDHSASGDNGVAGMVIGGCYGGAQHDAYCFESPTIDTSSAPGALSLTYWRHLHSDYMPYVHVWVDASSDDGANWTTVFSNQENQTIDDGQWTWMSHDVTAQKSTQFRVRFCNSVDQASAYIGAGWNIDDLSVDALVCQ